ncbi:uncharacterized protein [Rhodnius prolixus]|uniref:uncharacterized protein n=1 Tax=Rhodnius prolixus TaxID=13249 RepID=UPI003D18F511
MRTSLTAQNKHHPRAAVERVILPRAEGGRGVVDIIAQHEAQVNRMREYFLARRGSGLIDAMLASDTGFTPLNLSAEPTRVEVDNEPPPSVGETWRRKALHGQYPAALDGELIDKEASVAWLTRGLLFPETEGALIAIQDQVVPTRYYRNRIMNDSGVADVRCRLCRAAPETVHHLLAAGPLLAQRDYLQRHNSVARILHRELAQKLGLIQDAPPYYKYDPLPVLEDARCLLYWDREVLTDHAVANTRPDVIWHSKITGRVWLIDVSVPDDANIARAYTTKLAKYRPLAAEISAVWRGVSGVEIVPLIISATGLVPRSLGEGLCMMGIRRTIIYEMQQAVVLHTCRIVREVLREDARD